MSRDYVAFISYRHRPLDMSVAKKIHREIERYRIPKELRNDKWGKRMGIVFRDRDELAVSSDLSAEICRALDHSEFLIVVCTPDTPGSPWVQKEIDYFLKHHRREKIITVLAAGTLEESLPEDLFYETSEDEKKRRIEPLVAQIVGRNSLEVLKNLSVERLRIFSAILGCPYDFLRQRERLYRYKRILRFIALFFVIAMLFSGVLLQKNHEIVLKNEEISLKNEELLIRDTQITQQNTELQTYAAEIEKQAAELQANSQEISQQNIILKNYAREIEQQNVQLQISNTEAWIQSAGILLESGNNAEAVDTSVKALNFANSIPDQRESSVLLSKAEAVFAEASGLFDWNSIPLGRIQKIECDATNIAVQFFNHDRVALLNPFGLLEAYDTETGERIWSQSLQGYYLSSYISPVPDERVRLYFAKNGLIIAKYAEQLSAYTADGVCQWSIYASDPNYENSIVISADGSLIAFVDSFDYNYPVRECVLSVFETQTGRLIGYYSLDENKSDDLWPDFRFWSSYKPYNTHVIGGRSDGNDHAAQVGVFSQDNKYFYFAAEVAYVEDRGARLDQDCCFVYYRVNLDNPDKSDEVIFDAFSVLHAEEIDGSTGGIIALDEFNGDLIAYHFDGIVETDGVVANTSITMERISFADRNVVWKSSGEWIENPKGWYNHACYYRLKYKQEDYVYATLNGTMYVFDLSNGEKKLEWKLVGGEITSLYPVGDDFLQVTLDTGIVFLDWRFPGTWRNDNDSHIMYKIPEHLSVTASGSLLNPIINTYSSESGDLRELVSASADTDNIMAMTTENHDGIMLFSFEDFNDNTKELIDIPENYCAAFLGSLDNAFVDVGDSLLFLLEDYDDVSNYLWVSIDQDMSKETSCISFSLPDDPYDVTFVPEHGSILLEPDEDQPYLREMLLSTGKTKILFGPPRRKTLHKDEETVDQYAYLDFATSSVYSSDDNMVLTAAFDGRRLNWWKNANLSGSVVVPDEMRSYNLDINESGMPSWVEYYSPRWPFAISGSGLIVMAEVVFGYSSVLKKGIAYDTKTDSWYIFDASAFVQDDIFIKDIYIAEQRPIFATIDDSGCIYLYDVKEDKSLITIKTGFQGTISDVKFVINDEYLLLYSTLGISELYCVKTGERVLHLDAMIHDIIMDKNSERVYLIDSSPGAYCYGVADWNFIKYIPDAIYYDPERSEMYYFPYLGRVYVKSIPSRQELF